MTDDRTPEREFERLLRDAAAHYRVPPPPPLEAMWAVVEATHFDSTRFRIVPALAGRRNVRKWGGTAAGLAAGLLLGIGLGIGISHRASRAPAATPAAMAVVPGERDPAPSAAAPRLDPAYHAVATEYFDETVALLVALPAQLDGDRSDQRLVSQATDLLSTTRLLIDSPAGADPALQALLDDLELLLAQIVRLRVAPDMTQSDLIAEALETHDVLSRLRLAAARVSPPDQMTKSE